MNNILEKPYIGVSGAVSPEQQYQLEEFYAKLPVAQTHHLNMGIKATHKPQFLDIENQYGREWFPVGDEISSACEPSRRSIATAQVCMDHELVHNEEYRREFMNRLRGRAGHYLSAVQFDLLPWHENSRTLDVLDHVKLNDENMGVILQITGEAMSRFTPQEIAKKLSKKAIDCVLFDASCGRGQRLDVRHLSRYVDAWRSGNNMARVAIAGGLNAQIVREDLPELVGRFADLSWDAEGQLHPTNQNGRRPLDMKLTLEYLQASSDIVVGRS